MFVRLWSWNRRSGCGVIAFLVVKMCVFAVFDMRVLCVLRGKEWEVGVSEFTGVFLVWIMV